jgi:hypothetical protein
MMTTNAKVREKQRRIKWQLEFCKLAKAIHQHQKYVLSDPEASFCNWNAAVNEKG